MRRYLRRATSCEQTNFWSALVTPGIHYLHALVITVGLAVVLIGCSSGGSGPTDPTMEEAGGMTSDVVGNGGAPPAGGTGAAASAGAPANGGSNTQGTMITFGTGGQAAMPASCPTYADDFIPQINTPVCSKCHQGGGRTPDWGNYSQAKANCSTIGSRVASGAMPPARSGYTLTAAQKTLVADWVRLGCPQSKTDLPSSCQ
jgi:hypothetical protein